MASSTGPVFGRCLDQFWDAILKRELEARIFSTLLVLNNENRTKLGQIVIADSFPCMETNIFFFIWAVLVQTARLWPRCHQYFLCVYKQKPNKYKQFHFNAQSKQIIHQNWATLLEGASYFFNISSIQIYILILLWLKK